MPLQDVWGPVFQLCLLLWFELIVENPIRNMVAPNNRLHTKWLNL